MKVGVVGSSGMLGHALCSVLGKRFKAVPLSSNQLDITSLEQARKVVRETGADWIVNAAGFTDVDGAESEPLKAYRVNALGARNLAVAARENDTRLLHYSTDFVFDGLSDRPYREWDATNPINQYGRSKQAGEQFVRDNCPDHVIVRTSWLYGSRGRNFVDRISEKAKSEPELSVVDDQRGSPTLTTDLAALTATLLERDARGTYHATNQGECSWYEFAVAILRLTESRAAVRPVDSSRFPTPARRPGYSVLDNRVLRLEGIQPLRPWKQALQEYMGDGCV